MTEEKTAHTEIGRYISSVLDEHFGQSPEAVKVMVKRPYLLIHLHGFMLPNERFLLKRKEWKRVAETRDLLMIEMRKSLIRELGEIAEAPIKEIYADWNLERETGNGPLNSDNGRTRQRSSRMAIPSGQRSAAGENQLSQQKIAKRTGLYKNYLAGFSCVLD